MAPYCVVQCHSTPFKFGHENENVDEGNKRMAKKGNAPSSPKQPSQNTEKKLSQQENKEFIHKPHIRKPNILYVY